MNIDVKLERLWMVILLMSILIWVSILGLTDITGKDASEDLDGDDSNGTQSIQSVVSQEVAEAITQLTDPANQKTADEIFREAVEDTLIELESYDPDIFGA